MTWHLAGLLARFTLQSLPVFFVDSDYFFTTIANDASLAKPYSYGHSAGFAPDFPFHPCSLKQRTKNRCKCRGKACTKKFCFEMAYAFVDWSANTKVKLELSAVNLCSAIVPAFHCNLCSYVAKDFHFNLAASHQQNSIQLAALFKNGASFFI
jgi:hypothetical protein